MKILDFIRPELVVPDIQAKDKLGAINELAQHLANHVPEIGFESLRRVLLERERLASTAIGEGVAIPHGKLPVSRLVGCVAVSRDGIEFDSIDGLPTHIFFVLVAPESSTGIHLKALARISRLSKGPDFRNRLIKATDADDMFRLIAEEDAKY